ncbi:MAG: RNA polymerase-binding protein RbpA [Micrococcales bacterium]|nr:RNA polymerase-binding protein RbpA [Micrococcales bacterium]
MNSEPVRGSRLGSTSNETSDGVTFSPRQTIVYRCPNEHETELIFAAEVEIPETWDCKKCGKSAIREGFEEPEEIIEGKVVRTHFDLLLERRSREELEVILKEALTDLKERRKKNAS